VDALCGAGPDVSDGEDLGQQIKPHIKEGKKIFLSGDAGAGACVSGGESKGGSR